LKPDCKEQRQARKIDHPQQIAKEKAKAKAKDMR
jgi:hypothetical protein